ncbi:MAG: Gfo/Idh/MocA family oxidoreductase [Rhodospirillaceae bacterium]|nr:Gfo/Idh/MocA family oxidoreductase [Rhodospirillaceae bacterium]MDD9915845.1 Gfo/Idh/MocA family oxidoreductase [Rhodospirillaceae bacterium]MDD9924745.1 Gfo/Idh/MocA family oxidoreductase [Rhodospirillaceae bacterium]
MSEIHVGVIGLGSIGLRMLAAFEEHPDFVATRAWDPSADAVAAARAAFPDLRIADSAGAVIGTPGLDLVYVACPPDHHAAYALAARSADKAVLCEKPLGIDVADSEALVDAMATGPAHGVNFLLAASRPASTLYALAADGELGRIHQVEVRMHLRTWRERRYGEAPWLGNSRAGGFLREVGSHYVYFARRLLGNLTLQSAHVEGRDDVAAEHFAQILLHGGDTQVTMTGSTSSGAPDTNLCIVHGERATYRIRDFHGLDVVGASGWVPAYPAPKKPERETHLRQLDNVKRMLAGDGTATASFADALAVQRQVEAMLA